MSNSEKSFFEPKFGKSFSQVRIHEGLSVDKASAAIDAKAFTRGNDIAFARGQKTSATMAHELAHVVQTNGRVQRKVFRVCAKADKLAEGKFKAQPVVIADDDGKNKTTKPSFAKAKSIWAKCCLALDELSPITVKKKAYKDLQSSPAAAGTVEEKAMIADAGAGADTVPVFAVETITEGGTTSKDNSGGGYTLTGPNVVVVDAGTSWLSAHEIGHALGATHAQGTRGDGSDTVMKATSKHNSAGSDKVSAAIATTVRASGIVTGTGGSKTCCPDNS
ncbi:MAG: DUF4157 domain-containing protein [Rhodobacteraceae bacterium]|nr:DUF4157 domain-containing protein [Paracoccaceae bacterium]